MRGVPLYRADHVFWIVVDFRPVRRKAGWKDKAGRRQGSRAMQHISERAACAADAAVQRDMLVGVESRAACIMNRRCARIRSLNFPALMTGRPSQSDRILAGTGLQARHSVFAGSAWRGDEGVSASKREVPEALP